MDNKDYLTEGKLTNFDKNVKSVLVDINSQGYEFVLNALQWVKNNLREDDSNKTELFRKRTAGEIIKSGFHTGCSDRALVFITLARAKGIPTILIDTIMLDYFNQDNPDNLIGHVFAKVYISNTWYIVDPTAGSISINHHPGLRRYLVFAEGIDFEDGKMLSGSLKPIFKQARKQYEDNEGCIKNGYITIDI